MSSPAATETLAAWSSSGRIGASAARPGVLAERSRFVRQSGRWWYLDGKVS